MTAPVARRVAGHTVELQLYEWPGEGPPIFFAHATGFHARCWDQVIASLPGRHAFAVDMRGHGLSEKPEPPYDWALFGLDLAAVVRELGLEGAVGVGHSKGGHAITAAAAAVPSAFSALLLVDPVIMAPESGPRPAANPEDHFAARRRDRWSSPEEMFERFRNRPPFDSWQPAVLADYCRWGLVPAPDGEGFVLACPPRIEAAVYAGVSAMDGSIYTAVEAIDVPVRVLRARPRGPGDTMDMSGSPTAPDLAARFRRGEDVLLAEMTHFIPMQDPALVAGHVKEMVAKGTDFAAAASP